MAETGRSYEQIDEMTIFDVALIFEYWRGHPTAATILQAVHNIKPSSSLDRDDQQVMDFGPRYQSAVEAAQRKRK